MDFAMRTAPMTLANQHLIDISSMKSIGRVGGSSELVEGQGFCEHSPLFVHSFMCSVVNS